MEMEREMEMNETPGFERVDARWFVVVFGAIALLAAAAFKPPVTRTVQRAVPRLTTRALRAVLGATALIHLAEASYAWRSARRKGLPPAPWAAQTALVGFSSLIPLHRHPESP